LVLLCILCIALGNMISQHLTTVFKLEQPLFFKFFVFVCYGRRCMLDLTMESGNTWSQNYGP